MPNLTTQVTNSKISIKGLDSSATETKEPLRREKGQFIVDPKTQKPRTRNINVKISKDANGRDVVVRDFTPRKKRQPEN